MRKEAFSLATLESASDDSVKPVGTIEAIETLETIALKIHTLQSDQFALVTIALDFALDDRTGNTHPHLATHCARYYLEQLRSLVRRTDSVFLWKQTAYFLLPGANLQGGAIVQERLWDALLWCINNTSEADCPHPYKISSGYSSSPQSFIDMQQCINAACKPQRNFDVQPEKAVRKTKGGREAYEIYDIKEGELPELARRLGVPYVSFLPRKLPVRLQRLVAPRLAQELCCFPIGRDRDILTVAMSNPQDHCVLDRLRKETGLTIFPVLAHPNELQTVLEQFS